MITSVAVQKYDIVEYIGNIDNNKSKENMRFTITGLKYALARTEAIIEQAIRRRLSVIEKKSLYSDLCYQCATYRIEIKTNVS